MSHRVTRKTFRRFELRQKRDLARFKNEVLDAVARMTDPDRLTPDEAREVIRRLAAHRYTEAVE